ncbi:hypothetical protein AAW14_01880 [Streptomyces hygroscopicus]|nr:hypothetical protein [Streptomyces hygroscopicus]
MIRHPLLAVHRDGTNLPLTALPDQPLISPPRGTGPRGVLERICAEAGFRPPVAFEAADPSARELPRRPRGSRRRTADEPRGWTHG